MTHTNVSYNHGQINHTNDLKHMKWFNEQGKNIYSKFHGNYENITVMPYMKVILC